MFIKCLQTGKQLVLDVNYPVNGLGCSDIVTDATKGGRSHEQRSLLRSKYSPARVLVVLLVKLSTFTWFIYCLCKVYTDSWIRYVRGVEIVEPENSGLLTYEKASIFF